MREIYVIARRTSMTPYPDETHCYGPPGLWKPRGVQRVLVSCTFTWDKPRAEFLAEQWQAHYPKAEVLLGGPAYGDPGAEFVPGRFLDHGMTITTRGCPGCAQPCLVPDREGPLRCLQIKDGWNVLDNNLLAAPRAHIEAVLEMLGRQDAPATFSGGLEARRLLRMPWFVERLSNMRLEQAFLAYDCPAERTSALKAIRMLRAQGLSQKKVRCYVLIGRGEDSLEAAGRRILEVFKAGALPFAMLWRGEQALTRIEPEWRRLERIWKRPAATKAWAKENVEDRQG